MRSPGRSESAAKRTLGEQERAVCSSQRASVRMLCIMCLVCISVYIGMQLYDGFHFNDMREGV